MSIALEKQSGFSKALNLANEFINGIDQIQSEFNNRVNRAGILQMKNGSIETNYTKEEKEIIANDMSFLFTFDEIIKATIRLSKRDFNPQSYIDMIGNFYQDFIICSVN